MLLARGRDVGSPPWKRDKKECCNINAEMSHYQTRKYVPTEIRFHILRSARDSRKQLEKELVSNILPSNLH